MTNAAIKDTKDHQIRVALVAKYRYVGQPGRLGNASQPSFRVELEGNRLVAMVDLATNVTTTINARKVQRWCGPTVATFVDDAHPL